MSPLGISDPRQVKAALALAVAGFRVICPELPEIRNLRIQTRSIDTFTALVSRIVEDSKLAPSGQVALFAPSFSGAICLRAAAAPVLATRISAVCALGSMSGIRGSMEFLFLSPDADSYARNIVLSNYLPLVKKYAPLAPVFFALAHDNWNASAAANPQMQGFLPSDHAAQALRKLSPRQRAMVSALQDDIAFRGKVFAELTPFMELEIQAYDVMSVAGDILCPTVLFHGSDDNVIPAGESRQLEPKIKNRRLVVSPFLGHADTKISISRIPDVLRLISGFAWFFRHAAG